MGDDQSDWSQRIKNQKVESTLTTKNWYFSILSDENIDGLTDSQITHESITTTYHEKRVINLETLIVTITGAEMVEDFTREDIESEDFTSNTIELYNKRIDLYTTEVVTSRSSETLTIIEYEEGEIVATREYHDNFIKDYSYFNEDYIEHGNIESATITNTESEQEYIVDSAFPVATPLEIEWETPLWSLDDIPYKYDTCITTIGGEVSVESVYEATITIALHSQYSLYHDYLNTNPKTRFDEGRTTYRLTGVFYTPDDGKVYYTSDQAAFEIGAARTEGHYLYYDSDTNGLYETVFILAPDSNNDGIYDVISIGFNYDGEHDFIPYQKNTVRMTELNPCLMDFDPYDIEGDVFHASMLTLLQIDYFTDLFPRLVVKDHIFEVSKLINSADFYTYMPELFYETYEKTYAQVWDELNQQFLQDVIDQVAMVVTSSILGVAVSSATGIGVLGLLASTASYILFTILNNMKKEKFAQYKVESMDFDHVQPNSMSEKATNALEWFADGMAASNQGHPGAYYTTVIGGDEVSQFSGQLMVTPPMYGQEYITFLNAYNLYENLGLEELATTFANNQVFQQIMETLEGASEAAFLERNLDYFLLTSELPSLEENEFYDFEYGLHQSLVYNEYRSNTLGFLERKITSLTGGEYDTVRPICIDGTPQYQFMVSREGNVGITTPYPALYSPIVLSQDRYEELALLGRTEPSTLSIHVKSRIAECAEKDTSGVDPYLLSSRELTEYQAKIQLSEVAFNYPIESLTMDLIVDGEVRGSFELSKNEYTIEEGFLYFYAPLESIISQRYPIRSSGAAIPYQFIDNDEVDGDSVYDKRSLNILLGDYESFSYKIHLVFPTIIADSTYINDGTRKGGLVDSDDHTVEVQSCLLDTNTNHLARDSLAQATQQLINEYFSLYTIAATEAYSKAELDYTISVTFWSSLIAAAILAPMALAPTISSVSSSILTEATKKAYYATIIGIMTSPISEMYEEVYIDAYTEAYISGWFRHNGWDAELGEFVGILATSFREALMGVGSELNFQSQNINLQQDVRIDQQKVTTEVSQDIALERIPASESLSRMQEQMQKALDLTTWETVKSLLSIEMVGGLMIALPAFMVGEFGLGMNFLAPTLIGAACDLDDYASLKASIVGKQQLKKGISDVRLEIDYAKVRQEMLAEFTQPNVLADVEINAHMLKQAIAQPQITHPATVIAQSSELLSTVDQSLSSNEFKFKSYEENEKNLQEYEDIGEYIDTIEQSHIDNPLTSIGLEIPMESQAESLVDPWFWLASDRLSSDVDSVQFINFPKSYTIQDIKLELKLRYRITYDVDIYFYGVKVEVGRKIGNFEIKKDTTIKQIVDNLEYDVLSERFMLLPAEDGSSTIEQLESNFQGFKEVRTRFGHLFRGYFDLIFNTHKSASIIDSLFKIVIEPLSYQMLEELNFIHDGDISIDKVMQSFKSFFLNHWRTSDILGLMGLSEFRKWSQFLDSLFNDMFQEGLDNTLESKSPDYVKDLIKDKIMMTVFDYVLSEALNPFTGKKYVGIKESGARIETISDKIQTFLDDYMDRKGNSLASTMGQLFLGLGKEVGKTKFFELFAESFFSDVSGESMGYNREPSGHFGFTKEVKYFFYELPSYLANVFSEMDFDLKEYYISLKYDLNNNLFNQINHLIFGGIDITHGNSIQWPTSERFPDLNVYDFFSKVVSFHCKATSKSVFDLYSKAREITRDALSTMALDYYKKVFYKNLMNEDSPSMPTHYLELLIKVNDKGEAKTVIETIFRNTDFRKMYTSGTCKVWEPHIFLFEVVDMINARIYDNPTLRIEELDLFITNLFADASFKRLLEAKIKHVFKKDYKQNEIFDQGDAFFDGVRDLIVDNARSLITYDNSYDGGFKFTWEASIDVLFNTRTLLTTGMLPDDIFILEKLGDSWVKLGKDQWSGQFDSQFIVIHDENGRHGITRADYLRELPDNIQEGYQHVKSVNNPAEIIHNVYFCDEDGNYLRGRVHLDGKQFNILSKSKYFKDQYQIDISSRYSKIMGKSVSVYSSEFLVAIGHSTGNRFVSSLQSTVATVVPIEEISAYIQEYNYRLVRRESEVFSASTLKSPILFMEDNLMEIYFALFEQKLVLMPPGISPVNIPRGSIPYLNDKLGFINTRMNLATGDIIEDSGRTKSEFEEILNKLFVTKNKILEFLLHKDVNGELVPTSLNDITLKEWIYKFYKIMISQDLALRLTGDDKVTELIKSTRNALLQLGTNAMNIDQNNELFVSDIEAKNGWIILNNLFNLIGASTAVLIILRMVELNNNWCHSYSIDIKQARSYIDMERFIRDFFIVSSTQRLDYNLLGHSDLANHLFSLLCLDSFINLPVQAGISHYKARFGYSPLVFLDGILSTTSKKSLDIQIRDLFNAKYNQRFLEYFENRGSYETKYSIFRKSGTEIIRAMLPKIRTYLINVYGESRGYTLLGSVYVNLQQEIFSLGGGRIGRARGGSVLYNLRVQVENILNNKKPEGDITFNKIIIDGKPLTIRYSKSDFSGFQIYTWGSSPPSLTESSINKFSINNELFINRREALENEIKKEEIGGKVRIYVMINQGDDYGFQYINPGTAKYRYLGLGSVGVRDLDGFLYYDVDFNLNAEIARNKLSYILGLSMGYTSTASGFRNFAFDIKPEHSNTDSLNSYAIFDGFKFYKIGQIYSPQTYIVKSTSYGFRRVEINTLSNSINIEAINKIWSFRKWIIPYKLNTNDFSNPFAKFLP